MRTGRQLLIESDAVYGGVVVVSRSKGRHQKWCEEGGELVLTVLIEENGQVAGIALGNDSSTCE